MKVEWGLNLHKTSRNVLKWLEQEHPLMKQVYTNITIRCKCLDSLHQ